MAPCAAYLTTSPYAYFEHVIRQRSSVYTPLLGLRWTFGVPVAAVPLHEYSLPWTCPNGLLDSLRAAGGLGISRFTEQEGSDSLRRYLQDGGTAIVALDAFYLPFRPAFETVHSARTVVVHRSGGAGAGGRVHVRDGWRPASSGVVEFSTLDRARFSRVPLDRRREPLFAGARIRGEWFSIDQLPSAGRLSDSDWIAERLSSVVQQARATTTSSMGSCGSAAQTRFWQGLEAVLGSSRPMLDERRRAILILRPELTSRLYLCSFLLRAGHVLDDPALEASVRRYRQELGYLQSAIDVLTKTLRVRRAQYDDLVLRHVERFQASEERIVDDLSWFAR